MNFTPNLLGKVCFVIVVTITYLFNCFILKFLYTKYVLIDLILFAGTQIGSMILLVHLIEKFLKWLVSKYEKYE